MNRFFALSSTALLLGGIAGSAIAAPKAAVHHKPAVKKAKIIDVWECPINMDPVSPKMQAGKPVVVGEYRVHFCCPGCPSQFAKLSPKEKLAHAKAAYKKYEASKKAVKKTGK